MDNKTYDYGYYELAKDIVNPFSLGMYSYLWITKMEVFPKNSIFLFDERGIALIDNGRNPGNYPISMKSVSDDMSEETKESRSVFISCGYNILDNSVCVMNFRLGTLHEELSRLLLNRMYNPTDQDLAAKEIEIKSQINGIYSDAKDRYRVVTLDNPTFYRKVLGMDTAKKD